MSLYGVRCGVEFTDVTASRQQRDVDRLRAVIARLDEQAAPPRHPATVVRLRPGSNLERLANRRTAPFSGASVASNAS
jgi:hypothetical protein